MVVHPFSLLDYHCLLDSVKSLNVLRERIFDNVKSYLANSGIVAIFKIHLLALCSCDSKYLSSWALNNEANGKS